MLKYTMILYYLLQKKVRNCDRVPSFLTELFEREERSFWFERLEFLSVGLVCIFFIISIYYEEACKKAEVAQEG